MKRISSYFAPSGEQTSKRSKASTDQTESQSDGGKDINEASNKTKSHVQDDRTTSTSRKFQHQWTTDSKYKEWLQYDPKDEQMTCSVCIKTNKKNPFTQGCRNFRTSTLTRHMSSSDHVNAMKDSVEQVNFRRTIETAMDDKKSAVIAAMRCVYWLAKEKIATMKYSSLINLMKLQGCPNIDKLSLGDNATYLSDRSAEEFQNALALVCENNLNDKIKQSNVFSIMCDESDDVSICKKLIVYLRMIPKGGNFVPETHFLDNIDIDKGDAETLHNSLKSCAENKNIPLKKIMFLGSDGASVMTGVKSGVSARMMADQPFLVNIHCMAHKLALCTSQAADKVTYLKKYRETLTSIFYHFKHSSLRTSNLAKIEDVLNDKKLKIKEIHAVRWFAFYSALEAVFHCWGSLVTYFEQEKRAEKGGTAKGLHLALTQFEFVTVTYLLMDIIPILTKLSLTFQKEMLDISLVQPLVQSTISQLEYLIENDGHYLEELNKCTTDNKLNLKNHTISVTQNKQAHVKNIRTDFINGVVSEIKRRFPADSTSVVSAMAILGLRGISFVNNLSDHGHEEIDILCNFYGQAKSGEQSYIDPEKIQNEWGILKPLVIQQKYPTDKFHILWGLIHKYHSNDFPNLLKIAELALIAPLQTADCERGFSCQNDIKTRDRNRMSGDRLNKLMRITLFKCGVADFDYEKAVQV